MRACENANPHTVIAYLSSAFYKVVEARIYCRGKNKKQGGNLKCQ